MSTQLSPYSYRIYDPPPDQTISLVAIPFPFLKRSFIHVFVQNETTLLWQEIPQAELTWVTDGEIRLMQPTSLRTLVRRITYETDQLVVWEDGSYTIAQDLNLADLQWLHLIQEHHDWLNGIFAGDGPLPGLPFELWNRMPRYRDPQAGTAREQAQTVSLVDQLQAAADKWTSHGWVSDDEHVATTGALAERFDVIVSETTPPVPTTNHRQAGKFWINPTALKMYYWLPGDIQAWIEVPLEYPPAPGGSVPPETFMPYDLTTLTALP